MKLVISAVLAWAVTFGAAPLEGRQGVQAPPEAGSSVPSDTYLDDIARSLVERALQRRHELDETLVAYEAIVRERMAAGIRTLRRDRTLYRKEGASRVRWSRDDDILVHMIAGREEHPGGVFPAGPSGGLTVDEFWEPDRDQVFFGSIEPGDDDFPLVHPLSDESAEHYQYRSGDTLQLRFPDGRTMDAVEVQLLPRRRSVRLLSGSLWFEPETGNLVRGVYRLSKAFDLEQDFAEFSEDEDEAEEVEEGLSKVPGLFLPIRFELELVVVDYAVWDFKHWLPRLVRAEGHLRAGIVKAPASFELTYQMLDVVTEEDLEERGQSWDEAPAAGQFLADAGVQGDFRGVRRGGAGSRTVVLLPQDSDQLLESPELPPPIWKDMGASIAESEIESMYERLEELPEPPLDRRPWSFHWGHQRQDLLRYNKVEALSVGARLETPLGGWTAALTGRVATADPWPLNADLSLRHETALRAWTVRAYHDLASVDPDQRSLTLGSSLTTLLLGRDDGEYFRRKGASLTLEPGSADRSWWRASLHGERHEAVETNTDVTLPGLWRSGDLLTENIVADEGDEVGALLRVQPWWGTSPSGVQGGADLLVQGGAGDFEYVRSSLELSLAFPVPMTSGARMALQAAAGGVWGDEIPVQRLWYLGGPATLRGYDGSSAVGESFVRARAEVARSWSWGGLSLFSDAAWAGDRSDFDVDRGLLSVGVGLSTLDGLVRIDVARGLAGAEPTRFELYLDGLL